MSANDIPFPFPADFEDRYRKTYARLAGGEAMAQEQIAAALGLPLDIFVSAVVNYAYELGRESVLAVPAADNGGRERLLYDLLNFDLGQFDIWNIPQTKALLDQKLRSLDPIDDFWFNRLWEGSLMPIPPIEN